MPTMIRQLSFDFEKTQNVFSAMLPQHSQVLGGDMFGRAPVMWVLANWDLDTEKRWFLYTICNTPVDAVDDPHSLLEKRPIVMEQLQHVAHFMEVDNTRFPPVVPWNLFELSPRPSTDPQSAQN